MNNDYLFIGSNGYVAAFDTATGREIWRTPLKTGFFGTSGSDVNVLLHNDILYAGSNGHLFALDSYNGNIIWQNELTGLGYNDVSMAIEGVSVQINATSKNG